MLINRLLYFLELILLIPVLPWLYFQGKKLRQKISRLQAHTEFLTRNNSPKAKNILVIGESTAAGVGASGPKKTFAYQLTKIIGDEFNVYNLGKNGLKAERLNRLLVHGRQELPSTIHIAIILIGANDCFKFTPPHKFGKEFQEFINTLFQSYKTEKILVNPIPPVQQFPALPALIQFFLGWHRSMLIRELKHLAKKNYLLHYRTIDGKFPNDFFASDGIHPSDKGYQQLAIDMAKSI
jgi:lysophospholipase L1-like esterase